MRAAGWARAAPSRRGWSRLIDLRADEAALWGDLRKKWRQYVNKARTGGGRVGDAGPEALDDFPRLYPETAGRAGVLIRTPAAHRDLWNAFGSA